MTLSRMSIQIGMINPLSGENPFGAGFVPLGLERRRWIKPPAQGSHGVDGWRTPEKLGDRLRKFAVAHWGRRRAQGAIAEAANDFLVVIVVAARDQRSDARKQGGNRQSEPPSSSCP